MAIKVEASKTSTVPISYPKLMKSKAYAHIVLFTGHKMGTVMKTSVYHSVGYFSDTWAMDGFEDYEGSITLTNE